MPSMPSGALNSMPKSPREISRGDFGIEFNAPLGIDGMLVSDKVVIELEIQLTSAG